MEGDRKCFTVTWRIENYDFCFKGLGEYYITPSFVIDSLKDILWQLKLFSRSGEYGGHSRFFVKSSLKPDFRLDCEISFLANASSSPLHKENSYDFDMISSSGLLLPHHKINTEKGSAFSPPKTLTIRCKIFKSNESFIDAGKCFIRTRIRVEKIGFIGVFEKFCSLDSEEKKNMFIKSFSTEKQLLSLTLSLDSSDDRIWIEIIPVTKDYIKFCKCKLYLLDSEGTKTECGRSKFLFHHKEPQKWKFPLCISKENAVKTNAQLLSSDKLILKCEFSFSTGIEYERVEDSEVDKFAVAEINRKFPSGLEDITCLYKEGILCDMKLKTETEIFNVHKIILSARSSVFKKMFTTDMKEKEIDCVHIEDLDANTVRQMLLFLYSDNLEDLDLESAKNLYYAADKYNIIALKYISADFLKRNLQPSISCDILLLSDRHQDKELKIAVQEYIADHHEEILQSDQWMNLEKINPVLSTETFRALYVKNWKN